MRLLIFAVTMLASGAVHAHLSVLPHDHPHGVSWLPDAAALVFAALLVGVGVVVLRMRRKG